MKYPLNKPIKGDGLHCRVCGCTQHNACEEGCSWVKEPAYTYDFMGPLCSACAGTIHDLAYLVIRLAKVLPTLGTVGRKRAGLMLLAAARRAAKRSEEQL